MKTGLIFFFLSILALATVQAEDLKTRDGKVYHDYKVLGHDAGYLTILYSEGGGKIPLSELPDDLQKKYGYDKAQADAFVQATIEQDRKDRAALATERNHAAQKRAADAATMQPSPPSVAANNTPSPAAVQPAASSDLFTNPNKKSDQPAHPPFVPPGNVPTGTNIASAHSEGQVGLDGVRDSDRQAAIDSTISRIKQLKEVVRAEKIQQARNAAVSYLNGQGTSSTSSMGSPQEVELNLLRAQLRRMRACVPVAPKPTLTDDQVADIKEKINKLKFDIHDMQRELDRNPVGWNPKTFDYPDEIADEADQMKKLRDELPIDPSDPDQAAAAALKPTPEQVIPSGPLTEQDIDAIKQKIKDLNEDIAFMQKEEARHTDSITGQQISGTPHGGFADKIKEETQEVEDLTAKITPST